MKGYFNVNPPVSGCQVKEEFGKWLSQYDWDWFFTGTYRFINISKIGIYHTFLSFLNHISEESGFVVPKFWVGLEMQGTREIPHIHSLIKFEGIKNPKRLIRCDRWWKWWFERYGRNRIELYNKNLGAGYYLAKYIYKPESLVYWDICMNLEDWLEIRKNYLEYKNLTKE